MVGKPLKTKKGQLDEQIRKRKEMRKTKPKKRILLPDPKFNDVLVTRFV